jgi:hypothetical protein
MQQCEVLVQETEGDASPNFASLQQRLTSLKEKQDRLTHAEVGLREPCAYGCESSHASERLDKLTLALEKRNRPSCAKAVYKHAMRNAASMGTSSGTMRLSMDEARAVYKETVRIE